VSAEEELKKSYEKLQKSLEETINAIASALEKRDPYTAGHQQRVANLACAMAEEMGLSRELINGIRMAGLIHDVGKIQIPIEILIKPNHLSDIEFIWIRMHPQIGFDILKSIEFPYPVAQIVLQHHEMYNGSGYPKGLAAEEILQEARIIAVADVVEAMSSHRPYRPALGIEAALDEIQKNRGILYDPEAVDVCLKLFSEKRFKLG
jgi:putative nucleotidyltransferase with HDIG domain